jgi:hypothetical protein
MKPFFLISILFFFWLAGNCQLKTELKVDHSKENVEYWNKWVSNLTDMGVEATRDSFYVKEEVIKALTDSSYRATVYPEKYEWPLAIDLLQKMELKKAFWHLMNLYESDPEHRSLILGTFVAYDSLMDMSKVLLSTYYTYGFADPRVCRIKNNKPDIYRPDLLEKGLIRTKEMVNNILASREIKKAKTK